MLISQILDVLATFNENPYIRYYQPTHHAPLGPLVETMNQPQAPGQPQPQQPNQAGASSRWRAAMGSVGSRTSEVVGEHLSKKIASTVQDELDRYLAMNPDFAANNEGRPRGTLFVVDRSMDLAAPFLHEFFYQAMINDLLPLHDGKHYEYTHKNASGGEEKKVGVLSDLLDKEDEVWLAVRHMHMKDAIDYITGSFGKFARENAGFSGNAQDITMDDLKDLLATLPGFQEKREQFSMHVEMSSRCMDMFAKNKINLAANVEQCCATEKTPEGKAPKFIVEEMVPLLDEKSLSTLDKVRIIALYILFRDGVADEDRRRLFQHAKFGISEQDMVNNLVHLGAKIIKVSSDI
jgi:syntaxin-binding protein 1